MKKKDLKPLEQEVPKHAGRKKKSVTACMDKKRGYFSCGICGSENLVDCGVIYCNGCGVEEPYVTEKGWWGYSNRASVKCKCPQYHQGYWLRNYKVTLCVDCDAIKGPLCPNCKKRCWSKGNKRYCKDCGYRRD